MLPCSYVVCPFLILVLSIIFIACFAKIGQQISAFSLHGTFHAPMALVSHNRRFHPLAALLLFLGRFVPHP